MGFRQYSAGVNGNAQLEIPASLFAQLIRSGALTGNNVKCLDNNARKTLWQSLLNLSVTLPRTESQYEY
ncbi:hypothetical protein SAMN05216262_10211 [Colwellia chukchiensis]|uniref:Uncharacterized protein n=1 Tax=Colwellia chukchiensis TaxID=641665 RepID=A0A1H7IQ17_9GAMM|nr:hypothetical protein [Colwellia chukchiensis]SEK64601.1 hypothetical protein SAMN05216262_10211 [Colwellia chukchiensis]